MIHFHCRYCRRQLDAEDALVGHPVVCPGCKARVSVPSADEPDLSAIYDEANRSHAASAAPESFFVRLLAGCLILLIPLPIAFLFGQPWLCYVTLVAAVLVGLVGEVWLLLVAFSDSVWQGILVLLVPCYAFIYVVRNWQESKHPFLLLLAASAVELLGGVVLNLSGG
jgi:hypothetical protein